MIYLPEMQKVLGKSILRYETTNWLKMKHEGLRSFLWLMVIVVSALNRCLPKSKIIDLLVLASTPILDNEAAESALRVNLGVNVESWRSAAQVRNINNQHSSPFGKSGKTRPVVMLSPGGTSGQ